MLHCGHITAWYRKHDSDILLTLRRLGPMSDHEKIARIFLCAQRTLHPFCVVSHSCKSRGPRHSQSMCKIIYHEARDMSRKAKHPKNGSCETILERWHIDADYQKSLSAEGWTEEKVRQYDALALAWIVRNEEKNKKFFKGNQMNYILQPYFKMTQRKAI